MRGNILVLWSLLFDGYQFAFLFIIPNSMLTSQLLATLLIVVVGMPLDRYLIGVAALLQARIIHLPASIQGPLQFFSCLLVRVNAIFERFDTHLVALLREE